MTFILKNDIELTSEWTPIGTGSASYFAGTFDGNGHTISGLDVDIDAGPAGLFGYLVGEVKDLTVEGKISSGDLAISLDMTPQALSYHLSKLKKADLIYETRYKNYIYYELNLSILDETIMWISNLRGGQQ